MFEYSYATTEGAVRKVNQDALMIKTARYKGREILFAAVCDGIGGLADGEKASSCVIGSVSDWFENVYPSLLRSGSGAHKQGKRQRKGNGYYLYLSADRYLS